MINSDKPSIEKELFFKHVIGKIQSMFKTFLETQLNEYPKLNSLIYNIYISDNEVKNNILHNNFNNNKLNELIQRWYWHQNSKHVLPYKN